jgi:hypothetical protein
MIQDWLMGFFRQSPAAAAAWAPWELTNYEENGVRFLIGA